ncbi:MAG: hypothetical protein ACEPO8_07610 [Rhodothermaceae bacterium]
MQLVNGNMNSGQGQENYSQQLVVSRFRNLGKEKFQHYLSYDANPIDFIKECSINYAINLPQDIGEFMISIENIPYFWLADVPVFNKITEFFRREGIAKGDFTSSIQEIKKFFSKWLLTKSEKERQFYSTTALNLIEKDVNRYNYQKYIYKALLITFDKRISNAEVAINSMQTSIEVMAEINLEEHVKSEIEYLLNLTLGFVYLKSGYQEEAFQSFEALGNIRPTGPTGVLYRALAENMRGFEDNAMELLSSLLTLDIKRFGYALKINKIEAYQFFLKNAYVYQLFKEDRFAASYSGIESLVDSFYVTEDNLMYRISLMRSELEELRLKNYYTIEINEQLKFIDFFIDKFRNSQSQLVLMTATMVKEKLINIANEVLAAIKDSKIADMMERLHVYDHQVKDANNSISNLRDTGGKKRERLDGQLKENVDILKGEYKVKVEHVEKLIKNLDSNSKFDTGKAFSTALFYNAVIALFIFIIGGFGSGMMSGSSGFKFNEFVISGMKWGGVSFVLGFFAAIFSVVNAITEKGNEKSRLNKFMNKVLKERDTVVARFMEDNSERIAMFDQNYSAELNREENRLEKLQQEKEAKFKLLNEKVEFEMSEYKEKIDKIIRI